jgi:integrase
VKTITLAEAVDRYLEERREVVKEDTYIKESMALTRFLEAMGTSQGLSRTDRLSLVEGLANRLQAWVDRMNKTKKPWTIRYYTCQASHIFRWCIRNGYMINNPMQFVRVPRIQRPVLPIFTHEQYLQCLECTKGTAMHWLITCAYRTGLSMVDICTLRWEEVDMDNLIIQRKRQKILHTGAPPVIIPFLEDSDLHQSLLLLREAPVEDAWPGPGYVHHELAATYKGSHARICMLHAAMLRRLGIKGLTFKSWRNTFISNIANSGANAVIACKMSGHANPAMLAAYIKPDISALREAITKASDFMERKNEKQITIKSTAKT